MEREPQITQARGGAAVTQGLSLLTPETTLEPRQGVTLEPLHCSRDMQWRRLGTTMYMARLDA